MKKITMLFMCAALGLAQSNHVQQLFYNGSGVQYVCDASASVAQTTWTVSDSSLTNVVVSSNVGTVTTASAHNLWVGAWVTLSGSSTTALNGSYAVASVGSSTTFTVATNGVSDGTYTTGLVMKTYSPLLSSPVWSVTVYHYSGSNVDGSYPGGGPLSLAYRAKCSDRAAY